jgi:hypothetical protein
VGVAFTWPTGWQSLGGGWNGNWTQTGSTVTVTNTTGNGTLAAGGGTTSVGFVGAYSGPNVLPGPGSRPAADRPEWTDRHAAGSPARPPVGTFPSHGMLPLMPTRTAAGTYR